MTQRQCIKQTQLDISGQAGEATAANRRIESWTSFLLLLLPTTVCVCPMGSTSCSSEEDCSGTSLLLRSQTRPPNARRQTMANRQQQLCYICKSLCFREQKESQAKQMSPDVATRGREVEKHTNSRYKRTVSKRSRGKKCVCVCVCVCSVAKTQLGNAASSVRLSSLTKASNRAKITHRRFAGWLLRSRGERRRKCQWVGSAGCCCCLGNERGDPTWDEACRC